MRSLAKWLSKTLDTQQRRKSEKSRWDARTTLNITAVYTSSVSFMPCSCRSRMLTLFNACTRMLSVRTACCYLAKPNDSTREIHLKTVRCSNHVTHSSTAFQLQKLCTHISCQRRLPRVETAWLVSCIWCLAFAFPCRECRNLHHGPGKNMTK